MHNLITTLIESYGYVLLFLLVGLESFGIPLPGETALVTAAAFAASGHLSIYEVVATAAAAAILGDNGGYWIGRKGGLALVRRYGRFVHLNESHIRRAQGFFDRHGPKTVFIGRFIALLRTWAAVLAGIGKMRYGVFMAYNAAGGIVWSVAFGALGYIFGRNLPELERYMGQVSMALALFAVLVVALALGARWFQANSDWVSERVCHLVDLITNSHKLQGFRERYPRAWSFMVKRFERGGYLGLHLTIGLIISLAALWLFGGVTEDVVNHDPLTQFDLTLLNWLHQHDTPSGLSIFAIISWFGSPLVIVTGAVLVAVRLAWLRRRLLLAGWVAALAGGGILDTALKHIIQRPRPIYAAAFLHGTSYSFPSGHAMGSLVGYGMLAYFLVVFWATRQLLQVTIIAASFILIAAIGFSRLYLGVHYFSDVIGGYAGGILWLSTCITAVEIARRQQRGIT